MKKLNAKDKAFELMETYGTYAPFVVQEIISNMKLIYNESFSVISFEDFKFHKFWKEVERNVMLELTANSIQYGDTEFDNEYQKTIGDLAKHTVKVCAHVWGEERNGVAKCMSCGKFSA